MALDHDTSLSRPGAATESPQRKTSLPRSMAARSRQGGTGIVEGTRTTVEERTTSPGLAIPPIRIPEVTQGLGPDHPIGQGLVWVHPDLRLHQMVASGRQRGIGVAEAL